MMNFQLSIDVRDLEQISPRPKYLNQIEYLNITNKHTNRKSFNFKDAPNNCTFVMDVFDHVSSLLDAVHSPICNNNTFNFTTNNNTNMSGMITDFFKPKETNNKKRKHDEVTNEGTKKIIKKK
eukprot:409230_1